MIFLHSESCNPRKTDICYHWIWPYWYCKYHGKTIDKRLLDKIAENLKKYPQVQFYTCHYTGKKHMPIWLHNYRICIICFVVIQYNKAIFSSFLVSSLTKQPLRCMTSPLCSRYIEVFLYNPTDFSSKLDIIPG